MSTTLNPATTDIETDKTSFRPDRAPHTFDPTNRNTCPSLFDEKWQSSNE